MHQFKFTWANIATMAVGVVLFSACTYNYLEKPRPMYLKCKTERQSFMNQAAIIFERNGYSILERDDPAGTLMVEDHIDTVAWRYTDLVRTWKVQKIRDSVVVEVWSVSTRKDGSDVKQTWDRRWGNEVVKEWMRPVLISIESACGLGSPLAPN
ncbi:MAG: hypothetical protein HYX66_00560 [Ignavibacteria bacterium]|nr:hypothetical protein [Ignavibacteria bacterium]